MRQASNQPPKPDPRHPSQSRHEGLTEPHIEDVPSGEDYQCIQEGYPYYNVKQMMTFA
jgi:hypothetical protein